MKDCSAVDPGEDPIGPRTPAGFDQTVAPHPAALSRARDEVRSKLESWSLSGLDIEDILLIHSELVTNAMQQGTDQPISVTLHIRSTAGIAANQTTSKGTGSQITMVVTNKDSVDRVPHPDFWHPSSLLANTGRGLLIVGSLSDRVDVTEKDGQVAVTSWFQLR